MKILIVGGGGREHAIAWKLTQSKRVTAIYCAPGNGGIGDIAECIAINPDDIDGLLSFSKREKIDLVVVGPENPLASGIVDIFEQQGIPIFGPGKTGAQIEASKIFSKRLMDKYHIPTASFRAFSDYREARNHLQSISSPFVIKADGLCAGKGAYVVRSKAEGAEILGDLMVQRIHGDAGREVIIEDCLVGIEASYIAFTDGKTILPMLASQDHKALYDDDRGPNTGGMGAYTPIPFVNNEVEERIISRVMTPTIEGLRSEGILYKGALYAGLMLQGMDPYVIEFNARLGDPETQPLFFHMESDLLTLIEATINGSLHEVGAIQWKRGVSVCVVLASRGYPDKPEKGLVIKGLDDLANRKDVMVFHAGTKREGKNYVTSGGRVLGVTATGATHQEAIEKAYEAVSCIEFEGMQFRKDIGKKAIPSRICTGCGI